MKIKKRVVIGTGHPWYCGSGPNGTYAEVRLYKKPLAQSIIFRRHDISNIAGINPKSTGNWNKIRLVAEVIE